MADRGETKRKLQAAAKKRKRQPKGAAHAGEFIGSGTQKLHNIFLQTAGHMKGSHKVESEDPAEAAKQRIRDKLREANEAKKENERLKAELRRTQQEAEGIAKQAARVNRQADERVRQAEGEVNPYDREPSDAPRHAPVEGSDQPGIAGDRPEAIAIEFAQNEIAQKTDPEAAIRLGLKEARIRTNQDPDQAYVRKYVQGQTKTIKTMPSMEQRSIDDQTGDWWTKSESPDTRRSKTGVQPDASRRKRGKPSEQKAMMSPEERKWLDEQSQTEGSFYYQSTGKGGIEKNKANLRIYASLREEGYSPEEAHAEVMNPQRVQGQGQTKLGAKSARPKTEAQTEASKRVEETIKPKPTGVQKKTDRAGGKHEDFAASVRVPGVDIEQIKKDFPDWTDTQLVEYERQHKQDVYDWLEKNERWAHEQRVANVLGKPDTGENKDRVVFFTTNVGSPAASVPANSLIGQYVIKKRKKMLVDERNATRSEVKGEFPRAVRDQHLIEVSTGVSLGAQGRYGAFHTTGWKAGKKRSKGYGKQVPVGTQVLRDKNNQPVYDKNGNLRYTEGYTRPFTVTTDRDVGLRIFIG